MNISAPFIRRPIGTILLSIGLFLAGIVAYSALPVASLPNVDMPAVRVGANLPGADPETVAATIAAPLERRIGEIAGVKELTSTSSLGSTSIQVQFDLSRNADDAARDVQAAINAAQSDLPSTLTRRPTIRKANAAAAPIMIMAMTSPVRRPTDLYDLGDLIASTRISQVSGIAEVMIGGAQTPAVRIVTDPGALKTRGLSAEDVRTAITQANSLVPIGVLDGAEKSTIVTVNGQLSKAADYEPLVVKVKNGDVVRIGDVAQVSDSTSNRLSAGFFNRENAVILIIFKTSDANVIETIDNVYALLPELQRLLPADVKLTVLNDRTQTIRASIADIQHTLIVCVALVMLVVLLFLRRIVPTLAAGAAVPLSLAGTVALMWASGYSLDNISLLALTISVGFVVDDAIVVIENCYRNMEAGMKPMQAALVGSRQIGFTIVSISLSLIAAFIPLLFMGGMIGRLFGEFAWTLTYAILISAIVSLTLTPMVCARFIRSLPRPRETWLDRRVEPFFEWLLARYERSLTYGLRHRWLMLVVTFAALAFTIQLFIVVPKGLIPTGDTGLIMGFARASPESSFEAVEKIQEQVTAILTQDPAIEGVASSIGAGGGPGSSQSNEARFFVSLKPIGERKDSAMAVINRLRPKFAVIKGVDIFMMPGQEIMFGGRQSRSQYQVTLWGPDLKEIAEWLPKAQAAMKRIPGVIDVNSDREAGGPQVTVTIDRVKAAKFGVSVADVNAALNNAFSQRAVSTVYSLRNQYNVILEADPAIQSSLQGLESIYVKGSASQQVPLSSVATITMTQTPLSVRHTGQFPSATVSFNLSPGVALGTVVPKILDAGRDLGLPEQLHFELSGETLAQQQQSSSTLLLILAALVTVYIVLGILYEDLVHPLTILSTLPSAGFGALLVMHAAGETLSIISLIGIILLIGLVKKNGIMLVDFALDAERRRGLSSEDAIRLACIERFRPILMTTLAAMFGALPLVFASGPGSELRTPLGLTIVGGLAVSQLLTIYTTPVIYLWLDKLRWRKRRAARAAKAAAQPEAA
ncbi:efflux RND transporter permease subunit [Rhodomicrobium lacus]|uniref:efflux RND transporter permease subunit n=1 Tax=Rhodomicrobium lacus TaxID=2498452 RepID=UPI000F8E741B|nr:efflux RND transporter permease subunit [Rhodomicrobium lacus]